MALVWKKCNINDYVRVALTDEGKRKVLAKVGKAYTWSGRTLQDETGRTVEQDADILYKGWREGKLELQLWCLMELLGADIHIGASGPIETGIEIQVQE